MHPKPRRIAPALGIVLGGLLAGGCAAPPADSLLRRGSRLFDGRSLEEVGWEESLDRLAEGDVACVGETHLDRLTHDAELEILAELAERRGGRVTLAMEMFERDVQPALDDYLAGRIDEPTFLARARPWRNYATDYRPLVEFARAHSIPVIAANLPASLRGKLSRGGQEAFDGLAAPERDWVPERLFENPPEYWERVENATRGHGALMGAGAATSRPSRLFDAQNLWDNTMADSIARELARRPDRLVVFVVGSFHVERWQGTVWQLLQRRPEADVRTVAITATGDLAGGSPDDSVARADLLVRVESRARSETDGTAAVSIGHEQQYRLRLPPDAEASRPLPLLVWLCEDGQSVEDAMALWEPVLGQECALLALEPSYPFLADDGVRRGRWFFPGSVDEDGGLAAGAIERVLEQMTPPVDRDRVVVAGERSGATMAVCAARFAGGARFDALAFVPAAREEIERMSLPLPPGRSRPHRRLTLFDRAEAGEAWREASARDGELLVTTTVEPFATALAESDRRQVDATRAALGLPPLAPRGSADELLRGAPAEPRARFFTRVLARRARALGLEQPPSLAITAEAFADGSRLPRSSGSFGGTTIVVLDDSASEEEFAAWKRLEEPDVLQKQSRFLRLRIARGTGSGELSARAVIEALRAENPQRRDFLLVPAEFCAGDDELQALRSSLGPLAEELRLEILPGLGDRLPIEKR